MRKTLKRLVAFVVCVMMFASLISVQAFAAEKTAAERIAEAKAKLIEAAEKAEFWREWAARNKYNEYWREQFAAARDGHQSREIEYAKGRATLAQREQAAKETLENYNAEREAQFNAAVAQREADAVAAADAYVAYCESLADQIEASLG